MPTLAGSCIARVMTTKQPQRLKSITTMADLSLLRVSFALWAMKSGSMLAKGKDGNIYNTVTEAIE
ncbi:MAG: hypothetical protein NVV59_01430 [Chitinophagaceae bacterium]|nr:hypothetical protein [Chitinophagaceae bacterium]